MKYFCDFINGTLVSLVLNMEIGSTKSSVKDEKLSCNACDKTFVQKHALKNHIETEHLKTENGLV